MRIEPMEHASSEAILAVVLGAVLATLGGFLATQFEAYHRRKERQRDTALLFGGVFTTILNLMEHIRNFHGRGDPFGPKPCAP